MIHSINNTQVQFSRKIQIFIFEQKFNFIYAIITR